MALGSIGWTTLGDVVVVLRHDPKKGLVFDAYNTRTQTTWTSKPIPEIPGSAPVFQRLSDGDRSYAAVIQQGVPATGGTLSKTPHAQTLVIVQPEHGPFQRISVPSSSAIGQVPATTAGSGVFISDGDPSVNVTGPKTGQLVDVAAGKGVRWNAPAVTGTGCEATPSSCAWISGFAAVAADEPVWTFREQGCDSETCTRGVAVGELWRSDTVGDRGTHADLLAVSDTALILRKSPTTIAAVAPMTGKTLATIKCPSTATDRPGRVVMSPNGKFAAWGPAGFDLARGTGRCLSETGDTKAITLLSVDNDGTAYGTTPDQVLAQVSLTDSKPPQTPHCDAIPAGFTETTAITVTAAGAVAVHPRR